MPTDPKPEHAYQPLLSWLAESGQLRRGQVHEIEIRHDDGCPRLSGGICDCPDPEIVIVRPALDPRRN